MPSHLVFAPGHRLVFLDEILTVRDHNCAFDVTWEHWRRICRDRTTWEGLTASVLRGPRNLHPRHVVVLEYTGADDVVYTQWFVRARIDRPVTRTSAAYPGGMRIWERTGHTWLWPLTLTECRTLYLEMGRVPELHNSTLLTQFPYTQDPLPIDEMVESRHAVLIDLPAELVMMAEGDDDYYAALNAMVLSAIPVSSRVTARADAVWDCGNALSCGVRGELSRERWLTRAPSQEERRAHRTGAGAPLLAVMARKRGPSLTEMLPADLQYHLFGHMAAMLVATPEPRALDELLWLRGVCRAANDAVMAAGRAVAAEVSGALRTLAILTPRTQCWAAHRTCRRMLLSYGICAFAAQEVFADWKDAHRLPPADAIELRQRWLDYLRMRQGLGGRAYARAPRALPKARPRLRPRGAKLVVWRLGARRGERLIAPAVVAAVDRERRPPPPAYAYVRLRLRPSAASAVQQAARRLRPRR